MADDDARCAEIAKFCLESCQRMMAELQKLIDKDHYLISADGTFVEDPATGELMLDDGVKLRAITELRHYHDTLIKILGLGEPRKSQVEVITPDVVEQEIKRLEDGGASGCAAA